MRRNIKLILAYDGTEFFGWQRQDGRKKNGCPMTRTVQGVVECALEKLHKNPVAVTASGRTDTGVHAAAQAANFYTTIQNMEAGRFVPALNSLLPHDVRVLEAKEAADDFHARFDARLRTYRYYFLVRPDVFPWELRYAWRIGRQPEIERLNDYARLLRGEMDCSAFAIPWDKSASRYRFISGCSFFMENGRLVFEISANAFLWKMVRSIAGTLIRFEQKGISPDFLLDAIKSGSRNLTGPTAPPEGLFLWKVDF